MKKSGCDYGLKTYYIATKLQIKKLKLGKAKYLSDFQSDIFSYFLFFTQFPFAAFIRTYTFYNTIIF